MPISKNPAVSALDPAPYWTGPGATLYLGDAGATLRKLPARSVHSVITSPPYWLQKDYGTGNNQLGLEEVADCLGWATGTLCGECYICHIVGVFVEVWRVLRDDGVVWLNLGDTYDDKNELVGIPWRAALALQADGWALYSGLPWLKPNSMPDSAQGRPGKATEDVFLLVKRGCDYFFDMEAVKVKGTGGGGGSVWRKFGDPQHRKYDRPEYRYRAWRSTDLWLAGVEGEEEMAGLELPVSFFSGAHYATFPARLVTPLILAATSAHGACAECNRQYKAVISKEKLKKKEDDGADRDRSFRDSRNGLNSTLHDNHGGVFSEVVGWWKMCGCNTEDVVPSVVLDPFVGSGTTVAMAIELGRCGIGIDLSEKYLRENAIPRIEATAGGTRLRGTTTVVPASRPLAPRRLH